MSHAHIAHVECSRARCTAGERQAFARARAKLDRSPKKNKSRSHFSTGTGARSFATVLPRATGSGCFQRVRAGRTRSRTTRDVCKAAPASTFSDRARIVRFPCVSAMYARASRDAPEGVAARHRVPQARDLRVLVRGIRPHHRSREESQGLLGVNYILARVARSNCR